MCVCVCGEKLQFEFANLPIRLTTIFETLQIRNFACFCIFVEKKQSLRRRLFEIPEFLIRT